jgi:streptogramin lyase
VVKLSRFGTVLYDRTVAASDGDVRPTLAIADLHGNLWVEADDEPIGNTIKVYRISESAASILGRSTINNSIVSPTDMALGPDGNVWLTLTSVQSNCIERIDAITGASRCFAVPTPQAGPFGITAGNDGALWFTEQAAGKIGRIATNGTIAEFREPYVSPTLISAPPRMSTFNAVRSVWFVAHVFDFVATTY